MSAVLDYLKESGVFYLSTMDGNQPRVRLALCANLKANCILLPQKPKTFTNSFWKIRAWKFLP